jgi:hypothetical protein
LAKKAKSLVIDGRGDQGLAFQVAAGSHRLDFAEGADDDMRLGHGIGHDLVLQGAEDGFQELAGDAVGQEFLALGEELELVQRTQQHRRRGMEHRIGETQVPGVIGQRDRHVVVAHAGEEQHQVVVEVVAQLLLHVTDGTHLQQPAQAGAGGHRHARDDLHQVLRFLVDHRAQADVVMVGHVAQGDGIGIGLLAPHQLPGLAAVLVGAEAPHLEFLAEKLRLELEILLGRAQGHRNDFFHHFIPRLLDWPPSSRHGDPGHQAGFFARGAGFLVAAAGFLAVAAFFGAASRAVWGGSTWRIRSSHCACVM